MAILRYQIPDMSCDHCVRALTGAIQQLLPGTVVQADLASHILSVQGTDDAAAVERGIQAADYAYTRLGA